MKAIMIDVNINELILLYDMTGTYDR